MGKKSRAKGVRYENQIATELRRFFPSAKRHLEYQGQEAAAGRDLDGTGPFAIQCKHHAKTPPLVSVLEIETDERYRIPAAFLKRTQGKGIKSFEVVVIPKEWFYWMLEKLDGDW